MRAVHSCPALQKLKLAAIITMMTKMTRINQDTITFCFYPGHLGYHCSIFFELLKHTLENFGLVYSLFNNVVFYA